MSTKSIILPDIIIHAALAGNVTEIRGPVRPQPDEDGLARVMRPVPEPFWRDTSERIYRCPLGMVGDKLVVREAWGVGTRHHPFVGWRDGIEYRADECGLDEHDPLPLHEVNVPDGVDLDTYRGRWRGATEMPLWASRLAFDVLGSRVERLNDISDESCAASGVTEEMVATAAKRYGADAMANGACWQLAFADMWNDAHGCNDDRWERRGDCPMCWASNQWVWVATVRRA